MNTIKITDDLPNLQKLLNEVEQAYFDIPFGNTRFQQEVFVVAAAITPQRAYRIIGLQLHGALNTLRTRHQELQLQKVEIEELQEQLNDSELNKYERKKLEIKIQGLIDGEVWERKLLNDTIKEAEFYYTKFKSFPKYTREEFEAGERLYFEQSLSRQLLGVTGAKEAVMNMLDDTKTIANFEDAIKQIPHNKLHEVILKISSELAGSVIPQDETGKSIFQQDN